MSAVCRPNAAPGLSVTGVVAVAASGAGGVMRAPGSATLTMGSPKSVASSSDFSWMPRSAGVVSR